MAEAVDRLRQRESRGNQLLQRMAAQQQIARLVAAQPQPQRVLRRRNRGAGIRQQRKASQARDRHAERLGNGQPNAQHNGLAVARSGQRMQGSTGVD